MNKYWKTSIVNEWPRYIAEPRRSRLEVIESCLGRAFIACVCFIIGLVIGTFLRG